MNDTTLGVVLLVAWPAFNILVAGYAIGIATLANRRRRREPPLAELIAAPGSLVPQTFWIVVPALNEERVVGRTVAAALALAAPGGRTEVLVVDDGSDDGTPRVLAGIDHPRLHVLRRDLPDARRGKGEALNAAYAYIGRWVRRNGVDPRRVAVGVIDGDGRGSANLLEEVAFALRDPRIGAVQCRVRIHNRDRLLGAVQDLEFGCVADASQLVRTQLGSVGLGGNGQFARLSALQSLGPSPWSDCLVEDLELGLRLHLKGVGVGYVWRASISQQGVVQVRRLLRQRTRWAQGNLQCIRYLPRLSASPQIRSHTLVEMGYYLLAPWLNAFGAVAILALWGYVGVRFATGGVPFAPDAPHLGAGLWLLAMLVPGVGWALLHRLRLRDERLPRLLVAGLAYPAFLFFGLVSTWRAVGRQVAGRSGWAKTERLAEEPATPVPVT
ncbi:MAG TPA: glycosyltransferase family 2 protein [Pilimelia sp.]|nr:glycosyltransferase family 2 protein [Pilimelia sp.]